MTVSFFQTHYALFNFSGKIVAGVRVKRKIGKESRLRDALVCGLVHEVIFVIFMCPFPRGLSKPSESNLLGGMVLLLLRFLCLL